MTNYISEIAKTNKQDRFNAIVGVLYDHNIPFHVEPVSYPGALGNIIVSFCPENAADKTVISAHYDNSMMFGGTPGANDNAAACSVLLNLILANAQKKQSAPLEFVFFDLEEAGFIGSKAYLRKNEGKLACVFNLDMCGLGSNTLVCFKNGAKDVIRLPDNADIREVAKLPDGDADVFIGAGIPTVYVVNSTDRDLAWYDNFAAGGNPYGMGMPDWAKTMHRSTDTPDTCNPAQVEKIFGFLRDTLLSGR